jgi:hypothetical protein
VPLHLANRFVGLAALVAAAAVVMLTADGARAASCGTERSQSGLEIFRIKPSGTTCRVARSVAGAWDSKQSQGKSASRVTDVQDRHWSCKIVRAATGTDPGFYPYTDVRCARGGRPMVVRFSLRS